MNCSNRHVVTVSGTIFMIDHILVGFLHCAVLPGRIGVKLGTDLDDDCITCGNDDSDFIQLPVGWNDTSPCLKE